MTIKEIERFQANGDDGKEYTIIIWQEFKTVRTMGNQTSVSPGLKSAKLADGRPCNRLEDNIFKVVETGNILTRI
jgi:hypothetical protein